MQQHAEQLYQGLPSEEPASLEVVCLVVQDFPSCCSSQMLDILPRQPAMKYLAGSICISSALADTFAAWKAQWDAEAALSEAKLQAEAAIQAAGPTGRQWFQQQEAAGEEAPEVRPSSLPCLPGGRSTGRACPLAKQTMMTLPSLHWLSGIISRVERMTSLPMCPKDGGSLISKCQMCCVTACMTANSMQAAESESDVEFNEEDEEDFDDGTLKVEQPNIP